MTSAALAAALAAAALAAAAPAAHAQDITFAAEQREYYFLLNETALVQIGVNNTHGSPVTGTLTAVMTQTLHRGGFELSNNVSNTATIADGQSSIDLDLGSHNVPTTLEIDTVFSYVGADGGARIVDLDPLVVHVVEDASQAQNAPDPVQASSEQAQAAQPQQAQPQPQTSGQLLQNSQLAQDSAALREEIYDQLRAEAASDSDLLSRVADSPEFQELDAALSEAGFEGAFQDAESSDGMNGTFEFGYERADGRQASISGTVADGQITEIQSAEHGDLEGALDALRQDPRFAEIAEQLEADGLSESGADASAAGDGAVSAAVTYEGGGEQATVTATVADGAVQDIRVERSSQQPAWWIAALAGAAAAAAAYAVYRARKRRAALAARPEPRGSLRRDYAAEARALLESAERSAAAGRRREACAQVGRAVRLHMIDRTGMRREATNSEVLARLDSAAKADGILECLRVSSLVMFALRAAAAEDIERMMASARRLIGP